MRTLTMMSKRMSLIWRLKPCVLLTPDAKVHCNPRRYPEAARVNWRERIVSETEDYVLLDKPGGILFSPSALGLLFSMH